MKPSREERTLAQLLKIARSRADELRGRVAGLEAAKAQAETSIETLAGAIAAEERGVRSGAVAPIDFGRYLNGAEQKRRALEATRGTLAAQIGAVRSELEDAFAEMKKLEHLAETGRRAAALAAQQQDAADAADLVSMRRRG